MTTAELIKKREEEKNKPLQETKMPVNVPPVGGMSMSEARMVGNGVEPTEVADAASSKPADAVSLYDAGVKLGNLGNTENVLKGKTPISTPEYEKFRNEVVGAQLFGVETEEQKKARERRDFIKQGLTGFTEGLSALANLYYTTKGAPSQKQVSQMPELSKRLYAERLDRDKKLEDFRAWQRAKAEKDADRAYQDALRAKLWEREDKKAAQIQENWERTFQQNAETAAYNRQKEAEQTAYNRKRDEQEHTERVRHNKAMEANAANKGTKTGSGRLIRIPRKDGEPMVFRKDDIENPATLAYIYKALPDEYKVRDTEAAMVYPKGKDGKPDYKQEGTYPIKNVPTKFEMMTALGNALYDGKIQEVAEDIQVVDATNPIHGNTQQSVTQQANANATANAWVESDSYETWEGGDAETLANWGKENPANSGTQQTMSNVMPTPPPTETQASDAPREEKPKPKGKDRYKSMVSSDKAEAEAERKAKETRIKKAYEKRANTVEEAKKLRAELNAILNEDLAEFDIEQFIKDNNIGVLDSIKYRLQYSDDDKERAKIKRKIQRLNDIIGNN